MKRLALITALLLSSASLAACSQDGVGTDTANNTEYGGLDFAPPIAFGDTVTGQIAAPQIDVWAIDLKAGDQFQLIEHVTDGDIEPDVRLYRGGLRSKISSKSFDANGPSLTKTYEAELNGRYFAVVRSYSDAGAGSYSLQAVCNGGPCAGEVPPPPIVELDEGEAADCIRRARVCAVEKLPVYNGAVGAVRARNVFDACLAGLTIDTSFHDVPATCATACSVEEAGPVCDGIVGTLPWLADQSTACVSEWDSCVDECYDAEGYGYNDDGPLEYGPEDVCVVGNGFNGSCTGYADDLSVCGGDLETDSCDACYNLCYATSGAWIDDLDTICSETCDCTPSDW